MTILLSRSDELPAEGLWQHWCATPGTRASAPETKRLHGLAQILERSFDAIRDEWWALGKILAAEPSGELGHAPTCTTYGSDMGLSMAWTRMTENLAATSKETVLVLCDDPWLFRQLQAIPGVVAGNPPVLWKSQIRLSLRGWLARSRFALRTALAAYRARAWRSNHTQGCSAILVYGHPASDAQGRDAYFGPLMTEIPELRRLLHTDCPPARAGELAHDGRTASLHGWGNPLFALKTLFARWQPSARVCDGPWGWLIRRAAVKEASGAAAATNLWQMHCHVRWLVAQSPKVVAWPWENHPWERDFVRACRRQSTISIGYQHTVVGPHMYNQSPQPNPDGLQSIPDRIVCNGPAYRQHLAQWGIPVERMPVGGTFRFSLDQLPCYDATAPVFVALSSDHVISAQMMRAIEAIKADRIFLVKDHPMFPFAFGESDRIRRTDVVMNRHAALSAVLYSTGSVGLEALLSGLPTFRFQPDGIVAMNILPPNLQAIAVDSDVLEDALDHAQPPETPPDWRTVLSPVDIALWREVMLIKPRP